MDMQFGEHLIYANEELLKQVWINLLDNAIKFSEPNGTVSVAITESGDRLSVSVSNHGRDIPKDCIVHIFNKFYQPENAHPLGEVAETARYGCCAVYAELDDRFAAEQAAARQGQQHHSGKNQR